MSYNNLNHNCSGNFCKECYPKQNNYIMIILVTLFILVAIVTLIICISILTNVKSKTLINSKKNTLSKKKFSNNSNNY